MCILGAVASVRYIFPQVLQVNVTTDTRMCKLQCLGMLDFTN